MVEPLIGTELIGTIGEFLDYARWVVSFFVIYYVIRFFTIGGKSSEEKEKEWRDRGAEWGGFVRDALEKKKEKDAKKGRSLALARPQAALTNLVGNEADDALDAVHDEKVKQFLSAVKKMDSSIKEGVHGLRAARHGVDAAFTIGAKIATMETVRNEFKTSVIDHLPKTLTEFKARKVVLGAAVTKAKNDSTTVLDEINKYISV